MRQAALDLRDVANGSGKGWAKGWTAATDPRVARNAAAHRGMTYRRHLPAEADKRRRSGVFEAAWSRELAYAVGLLVTDGNLSKNRRSVTFTSGDRVLVQTLLDCLGKNNRVAAARTRGGGLVYRTQIGDVVMYRWLESIGLMPRKSLVIGDVAVPDEWLADFLRGHLDGDGTISSFVDRPTRKTYPDYRYERLRVRLISASPAHIQWLQAQIAGVFGLKGYVGAGRRIGWGTHELFELRYGNRESRMLLSILYRDPCAPRLERKWEIWRRSSLFTEWQPAPPIQ